MRGTLQSQILYVSLLVIVAINFANAAPLVIPLEGESFAAAFAGIADGKSLFSGNKKIASLPLTDLFRYGDFVDSRRGPVWLLVSGGAIVAELTELDKETLRGRSLVFGKLGMPLGAIAGVLVHPPADETRRDDLSKRIREASGDHDRLILDNGDELTGALESLKDESISIQTATGVVSVELGKLTAIVFNPAIADKPKLNDPYFVFGFIDGSRLIAPTISTSAKELTLTTASGKFKASLEVVAAIQTFSDRVVYLSDRTESNFKHVPFLQLTWPFQKDVNVLGRPLRVDGKLYLKGLGMHTASRVAYKLDGDYRQFQAELAIDDSADLRGSAICSVFIDDGSGKWLPKYTSPILRGGDAPVSIRIDLAGVKAISLLADFADHGDELDHVDWLNARLVK